MSVVFTIGYEGTDIDRLVATLKAAGIRRLADVRAVAISRKRGFSKTKLAERLKSEGIEYLHFQKLGDPKPGRVAARAGQYNLFHAIYSEHLDSPEAREALDELMVVSGEEPTCLLCFERDPVTCHRTLIAKRLGLAIFDLFGDKPEAYVRNPARIPRHDRRQGAAAA